MFIAADGRCAYCGVVLDQSFHGDHRIPHAAGGRTLLSNAAASCRSCNLKKGTLMPAPSASSRQTTAPLPVDLSLRAWQRRALQMLSGQANRSVLLNAAPGAGKTLPSLVHAHGLLSAGEVERIVVVTPTSNVTRQWTLAAHRLGLNLEPNWVGVQEPNNFHGIAVTYQRLLTSALALHYGCSRERTLVIADEPHHLGRDRSWADAFEQAFEAAPRWLLLSGTPFRSDGLTIPGVSYDSEGYAVADFVYGYGEAVRDGICRAVAFLPYDGQLRWASDGRVIEADFAVELNQREAGRRHRTAVSPRLSEGLVRMISDADAKLSEVRDANPDAGLLIVAENIYHANEAAQIVGDIAGEEPVLVTSDDPEASRRLEAFRAGTQRCLVAVNMVSEGVDIPRLRVGVYATPKKSPLLFRQIVGRFVRTGGAGDDDCSFLFMPADPVLQRLAHEIEQEARYKVDDADDKSAQAMDHPSDGQEGLDGHTSTFMPLGADVRAQGALLSGTLISDPDEAAHIDAIARKRRLSPEQVLRMLGETPRGPAQSEELESDRRRRLRQERRRLVGRLHHLTGRSFDEINVWTNERTANGRSVEEATLSELEAGRSLLEVEVADVLRRDEQRLAAHEDVAERVEAAGTGPIPAP